MKKRIVSIFVLVILILNVSAASAEINEIPEGQSLFLDEGYQILNKRVGIYEQKALIEILKDDTYVTHYYLEWGEERNYEKDNVKINIHLLQTFINDTNLYAIVDVSLQNKVINSELIQTQYSDYSGDTARIAIKSKTLNSSIYVYEKY